LKILVRFKVDAYFSDDIENTTTSSSNGLTDDVDNLSSPLRELKLGTSQSGTAIPGSSIQIVQAGSKISHSSLLEIKTRAQNKPIRTDDIIRQLWFAQVRHLITAYHRKGVFIEREQKDFGKPLFGAFARFEKSEGNEIRKMIKLVEVISSVMMAKKLSKAVLLFEAGRLQLYERKDSDWEILPADLLSKWD
jgi:hypothetical protein